MKELIFSTSKTTNQNSFTTARFHFSMWTIVSKKVSLQQVDKQSKFGVMRGQFQSNNLSGELTLSLNLSSTLPNPTSLPVYQWIEAYVSMISEATLHLRKFCSRTSQVLFAGIH
jgi:hypothetical protein